MLIAKCLCYENKLCLQCAVEAAQMSLKTTKHISSARDGDAKQSDLNVDDRHDVDVVGSSCLNRSLQG